MPYAPSLAQETLHEAPLFRPLSLEAVQRQHLHLASAASISSPHPQLTSPMRPQFPDPDRMLPPDAEVPAPRNTVDAFGGAAPPRRTFSDVVDELKELHENLRFELSSARLEIDNLQRQTSYAPPLLQSKASYASPLVHQPQCAHLPPAASPEQHSNGEKSANDSNPMFDAPKESLAYQEIPSSGLLEKLEKMDGARDRAWQIFVSLDSDGGGSILAEDIASWVHEAPEPDIIYKYERTIADFNIRMGICTDKPSKQFEITFATFQVLWSDEFFSDETINTLGHALHKEVAAIRKLFSQQMNSNLRFTDVLNQAGVKAEDAHMYQQRGVTAGIEKAMEPTVLFAIVTNCFTLGMSVDNPDWPGWEIIEYFYVAVYVSEILLKIKLHSLRTFFFGLDRYWNYFDFAIVLCSLVDVIVSAFAAGAAALENLTFIRIIRMLRISRVLKLVRLKVFKELKMMIDGIMAGFKVIVWAIALLMLLIYCIALCIRLTIGDWKPSSSACAPGDAYHGAMGFCTWSEAHLGEHYDRMFGSMPKAMFTVLRCFIDGCSSVDGTPLMPHMWDVHGALFLLLYVAVTFFVMFGVFNVMTAIFVEQVSESSIMEKYQREESYRVAKTLHSFVLKVCDLEPPKVRRKFWQLLPVCGRSRDENDAVAAVVSANANSVVTKAQFQSHMEDPEIIDMLEDMKIASASRSALFDVLDADSSGKLEAGEIVKGLLKLRGTADKSDMVAALLGVRAVQKQLKDLHNLVKQNHTKLEKISHPGGTESQSFPPRV